MEEEEEERGGGGRKGVGKGTEGERGEGGKRRKENRKLRVHGHGSPWHSGG